MPFPDMLHSPLPFGIFGPLLARISRLCTGYVSDPGELRSLSFFFSHAAKQRTLWTEFPCTVWHQDWAARHVCRYRAISLQMPSVFRSHDPFACVSGPML